MNDQARQLLLKLIRDYGIDLAYDTQRLNALLKDYAKGQFKREIFLCVQAAREGIVLNLLNNQHLPLDALTARLSNQLQEDCGFDGEAANWAVETWLLALNLNLIPQASPTVVAQTPPATPVATATNNTSSQISRFTKPQPLSLSLDSDELTLLIEDSLSWFKKLLCWQQHYIDHDDGTVTDSQTGLQWTRFSLGQYWNGKTCEGRAIEYNLQDALNAVQQLNNNRSLNCGYTNWRIPTWDELNSIRGSSSQVINEKVFPNTPNGRFWTVSESTSFDLTGLPEKRFYTVNFNRFNAHYALGTALASDIKYTRLVR